MLHFFAEPRKDTLHVMLELSEAGFQLQPRHADSCLACQLLSHASSLLSDTMDYHGFFLMPR